MTWRNVQGDESDFPHCACGCTGCGAAEPNIDTILSTEPIFSDWTKRYWGGDKDRFQPMVHITIEDYRDRLRKRAMNAAHPPLTDEEEADRLAGDHYERDLIGVNTCICGEPWICPEWIKAVIAND